MSFGLKKSLYIGFIGSTRINISPLLIIIIPLLGFSLGWDRLISAAAALIIHEGGHIMMAKALGMNVESIDVLPFGGVLRIEGWTSVGIKEAAIAVSGPIANLAAAGLISFFYSIGLSNVGIDSDFYNASIVIFTFNMLPVAPLDGGMLFKSIACKSMSRKKAEFITSMAGRVLSVIIFIAGVYGIILNEFNISLFIAAIFIWIKSSAQMQTGWIDLLNHTSSAGKKLRNNKTLPVKELIVFYDAKIVDVLKDLTQTYYYRIRVVDAGFKTVALLNENDIGRLTLSDKLDSRLSDII